MKGERGGDGALGRHDRGGWDQNGGAWPVGAGAHRGRRSEGWARGDDGWVRTRGQPGVEACPDPTWGGQGSTQSHRRLRVAATADGHLGKGGPDGRLDQRRVAGAAGQADSGQLAGLQAGIGHHLGQTVHRLLDVGPHQVFQLVAGDPMLHETVGQADHELGVGVGAQRLFDPASLAAQGGRALLPAQVLGDLQRFPGGRIELLTDMVGQQLIEKLTTEAIFPDRTPDHREAGGGGPQYRGVEGAAPQVVDGDVHSRGGPLPVPGRLTQADLVGVGHRGGHWLGNQHRLGYPGPFGGCPELLDAGPTPNGGVGEAHLGRRAAPLGHRPVVEMTQQGGDQLDAFVEASADDDGSRVPDAALGCPHSSGRVGRGQVLRRLAHDDLALLVEHDDRRNAPLPTDLDDLGPPIGAATSGDAERRADVDAENPRLLRCHCP